MAVLVFLILFDPLQSYDRALRSLSKSSISKEVVGNPAYKAARIASFRRNFHMELMDGRWMCQWIRSNERRIGDFSGPVENFADEGFLLDPPAAGRAGSRASVVSRPFDGRAEPRQRLL